jgi:hypothetical protein
MEFLWMLWAWKSLWITYSVWHGCTLLCPGFSPQHVDPEQRLASSTQPKPLFALHIAKIQRNDHVGGMGAHASPRAAYFLMFLEFISEFKLNTASSDTTNLSRKSGIRATVFTVGCRMPVLTPCAGSPSLNFCLQINTYGWNLISIFTMARLNPKPFRLPDLWPFSVRDCCVFFNRFIDNQFCS